MRNNPIIMPDNNRIPPTAHIAAADDISVRYSQYLWITAFRVGVDIEASMSISKTAGNIVTASP